MNNDNGHAHGTSFSGHAQSIPINRHTHRTMEHAWHAQSVKSMHVEYFRTNK